MDRKHSYKRGLWAELVGIVYLMCKGYRPLAWRYKTRHGEIDAILVRGRTVVFVEVKARSLRDEGLLAITPKAQHRILQAAQQFIQRHKRYQNYTYRFDALVVSPRTLPYHMPDAWRSS